MFFCNCFWCYNSNNIICPVRKIPSYYLSFFDTFYFDNIVDTCVKFCITTGISPNVVTTISVNVLIIGFYHLFYDNSLIFAICWVIYFILDCVDGCLARASNQVTDFGDWFDHTRDVIALLLLIGLLIYKKKYILILIIFLTTILTINQLILQEIFIKNVSKEFDYKFEKSETYELLLNIFGSFGSLQDFFIKLFSPSFNNVLQALFIVLLY